jgi:two-component system LytT family response regulator
MVANLNSTINILIVDDENKACTNLENMLLSYVDPDLNIVGFAHDPYEAEEMIKQHNPHVVFLDIHMQHGNVFELLDKLSPVRFEVVFVTAYDEYAVKAFRLNALDYILKPISVHELQNAVYKLKERLSYKKIITNDSISYTELNNRISNKQVQSNMTFKGQNSVEIVNFKDIFFVEAQSSYSRILFAKEKVVKEMTMSSPLSEYEELLPVDVFFRIHKSYLVNCNYIKRIDNKETHSLVLSNDMELPISRRRYGMLLEFLKTNNYQHA